MLRIDGLHTVLDTDHGLVRAVEDLALSIERGETFALVGESGCGKSMTALSILRCCRTTAGSPRARSGSATSTSSSCQRRACATCAAGG